MSADAKATLYQHAQKETPPVSADADAKGAYVFARYASQDDHYAGFYRTWAKTILFLLNKQWVKWVDGQRRFTTDTDVPAWRQQPVTNVTYAVYRTIAAKLTKQHPTFEVVPPSGDSDDRAAAAMGQALLVHFWRLLGTNKKIRRGIGWYLCTGQVFLRVHWDPDAGPRVPLTELVEVPHSDPERAALGETEDAECPCGPDGKPLMTDDGDGGQVHDLHGTAALVPQGEVALSIEDPLSIRYDPEATDADDAREMFVARLRPRAWAIKHFKLTADQLTRAGDGEREMYDDLIASAASGALGAASLLGTGMGTSQQEAIGDRVLVLEYYHRPDADGGRPDGAHWITVGQTKVWPTGAEEAPLPNGFWPPLIPVLSLPIPGQPQAMGILPQVVPLNEQLNTLDGKIMEHEVTMSMGGKWIVHPADKGLVISSDPAQVLASKGYADGKPPIQADLKPLPAEVYAERAVLMDKIRTVMSLSEAELGKKPEGVSAGRAFLVLQEVTDSVLGPDLQAWEEALEEVGRRQLVLAQRHYREKRSIAIRGERGKWEVQSFSGADLTDGLDVRVQVGSSFPWSRAAQQDVKLNVLTAFPGLVTDSQTGAVDQERLSEFLDVGGSGLASFESDEDPDLVEIDREHAMFEAYNPATGEQQIPQIAFWQTHAKHLDGHYRFLKRDFGRFERWNDQAKAAFLSHCRQTAMAVDQLAQTAAAAGNPALGGASDGSGAPTDDPNGAADDPTAAAPGQMGGAGGTTTANERPTLSAGDLASADSQMAGA